MQPDTALYVMIGGFLGAGKTTAVLRLAQWLTARGRRVGLIDNDQGSGLVDTAFLGSHGMAVEEISGGCFCCRFNSLVEAAGRLTERNRPDVFVAEPVGSCTDLVATVTYPLRRLYGDRYAIAPLSVVVDPVRASRVLGLSGGARFSPKVEYIFRKQLEEADLIVVNKRDLLDASQLETLRGALGTAFPKASILAVSARTGEGLEPWFERLLADRQTPGAVMEIDYDVYADGEALLGWLNAAFRVHADPAVDANDVLRRLAEAMRTRLVASNGEIAHLKMTFEPDGGLGDLAVINLVRNDYVPELSQRCEEPAPAGHLTVNLRAEAPPEALSAFLEAAVAEVAAATSGLRLDREHLEAFRPGRPNPTHRMA